MHTYPLTALLLAITAANVHAHGINSPHDKSKSPAFDIIKADANTDGRLTTFVMELAGIAGSIKPESIGQLNGSKVEAYVWPTSLDPSKVGFDKQSGILALDSPGMSPILDGSSATITVPLDDAEKISFDAVTAELQIHAEGKVPLLCVSGVHDVASGDLSLPGQIGGKK